MVTRHTLPSEASVSLTASTEGFEEALMEMHMGRCVGVRRPRWAQALFWSCVCCQPWAADFTPHLRAARAEGQMEPAHDLQ